MYDELQVEDISLKETTIQADDGGTKCSFGLCFEYMIALSKQLNKANAC